MTNSEILMNDLISLKKMVIEFESKHGLESLSGAISLALNTAMTKKIVTVEIEVNDYLTTTDCYKCKTLNDLENTFCTNCNTSL